MAVSNLGYQQIIHDLPNPGIARSERLFVLNVVIGGSETHMTGHQIGLKLDGADPNHIFIRVLSKKDI